ncbi:hypothetical protein OH76DRAFT_1355261, partial [Lentinus brumalis]
MIRPNLDAMIESIYGDIHPEQHAPPPPEYFLNRIILSARNEDVDDINACILERMPGEERTFHSVDSVI